MVDDFDFLRDDDDDELPDWLTDVGNAEDDTAFSAPTDEEDTFIAPAPLPATAPIIRSEIDEAIEADEFDMLRERTALASEAYDDIDSYSYSESNVSGRSSGFASMFTAGQRAILAFLFLLNIIAGGWFLATLFNI